MSRLTLSFNLPFNASVDEVNEVIDTIRENFGITDNGGIAPTSVPATTPTLTNADTDKNGLPWDERIHASTKAKNADGTWRYRKGIDQATKDRVEAELRGGAAITATAAATPGALPSPAALQSPGALPAPAAPSPSKYEVLCKLVADNSPPITPEWLGTVVSFCTANAKSSLAELAGDDAGSQAVTDYLNNALSGK